MRRLFTLAGAALLALATCTLGALNADTAKPLIDEFTGQATAVSRTDTELQSTYEQVIDYLLADVTNEANDAKTVAARQAAETTLQSIALRTARPNAEPERVAMSKALVARAGATKEWFGKMWLLRELQWIGKAECVPALVSTLTDSDARIADAARRALAKNPSDEARDALRAQLAAATTPAGQTAYINALSERGDAGSVPAIAKLATSTDTGDIKVDTGNL